MIDYDEIIKTICMSLQGLPKKIADLRSSHSEDGLEMAFGLRWNWRNCMKLPSP